MEERRKFVRIKKLEGLEVWIKTSSGLELVEMKDMGLIGINFYAGIVLEKGHVLDMKISLPADLGSLNLKGEVLWQLAGLNKKLATGVRFHYDENTKATLSKFINEYSKRVDEHREFIRCDFKTDIAIRDIADPEVEISAKTMDISHGGMKLTLDKKIEIGTRIHLTLFLPGNKEAIECAARVVWAREEKDKEGFTAGIIYTELNEEVKDVIWKFIDNYCQTH